MAGKGGSSSEEEVRRADNGRYTTPGYGKAHPNKTVVEHDKKRKG